MSDKISREDAQAEINGLLVAEICRDFAINFRDVYPAHILERGVGPEQAFIGLAIKRGHLALPAVQPDAAAHGAEHWDTLAPWSKYSSDVVLVVHHILTEPAVPTATVRFELPERAGSGVLGHCAADTVEEAVMGAIDAAQAKLRAMIDTGKEVMPLDAGTTETQTQALDIGPGDQAVAGAAQKGDSHE